MKVWRSSQAFDRISTASRESTFLFSLHKSVSVAPKSPSFNRRTFKMQLIKFLGWTPLLSSFASATCYPGGEYWDSKPKALNAARAFCAIAAGRYDKKDETEGRCFDRNDIRYNFRVWNRRNGAATLFEDDCNFRMAREIIGCPHGGRRNEEGWEVMYVASDNSEIG